MLHQCKLHAACVPSVCIKNLPYLNVFLKSLYFLAHGIGCLMFKTNGYVGVAEVFLKHSWYFFCIVKLILSLFLAKELYFSVWKIVAVRTHADVPSICFHWDLLCTVDISTNKTLFWICNSLCNCFIFYAFLLLRDQLYYKDEKWNTSQIIYPQTIQRYNPKKLLPALRATSRSCPPPPPPSVTQVSLFKVVCEVREYEMCRDCGEFFCLHWYRFYRALAIVMLRDVQYTLLTKLASTAPSHPSQNYTKAPLKYWEPKNKFMINFQ